MPLTPPASSLKPSAYRLPPVALLALRFLTGLAIGWLFHYVLYRFSLPIQPFIYAAF